MPLDKVIERIIDSKVFIKDHDRKRICRDFELKEIIENIKVSYKLWSINSDTYFLDSKELKYLKEYLRICFVSRNKDWKVIFGIIVDQLNHLIGDSLHKSFIRLLQNDLEIKLRNFE